MLCELMKFLWCEDFSVEKGFTGSEGESYSLLGTEPVRSLCVS